MNEASKPTSCADISAKFPPTLKTSVPNRIGTNVLPGRTPGGFFPPITDVEIETYSEYKQPERNWKSKDHYCIMEAGNRVLERRAEINDVR